MGAKTDVNVVHFAELPTEERTSREYGTPLDESFIHRFLKATAAPAKNRQCFS